MRVATRREPGRCPKILGSFLLLAVLAVSAVHGADYAEYFREGIRATDERDWEVAARWFEAAGQERKPSGERLHIYGMRFVSYLPNFYLGMAHFRAGDFDAAEGAWRECEIQGVIENHARELKEMRKMRKKIKAAAGETSCRRELKAESLSVQATGRGGPSDCMALKRWEVPTTLAADVVLRKVSGKKGRIRARIGGYIYTDDSNQLAFETTAVDYTGDMWAEVGIGLFEGALEARWSVTRASDAKRSQQVLVAQGSLGSVALGETYRVSLRWDRKGEEVQFSISDPASGPAAGQTQVWKATGSIGRLVSPLWGAGVLVGIDSRQSGEIDAKLGAVTSGSIEQAFALFGSEEWVLEPVPTP